MADFIITNTEGPTPINIEITETSRGPAGVGVPDGGTTGQVLAKASADNYDTDWVSPGAASEITGLIEAGTNVTLTGSGTSASPYVINASGGSGSGTVTSVSVTTANGVSGSVANATTTPAITITLGAIAPTSVAASGNVTGANLSGTNTGDQTTITGNAGTATALQTARNINGVSFNGTANITVTAAAGTLSGTTLASNVVTSSLTTVGTIATGVWQGTIIAPAYLGTGTSITTKFLRGDGTWQTISGGGDALTSSNLDQFADVTQTSGQTLAITSSTTLAGGSHSGTNTGDQTITLTGNVTGTGTGTFEATISNEAVTFAKMANVSSQIVIGRHAGGNGAPQEVSVGNGIEFSGSGIRRSAFTGGDVTASAGSATLTLANTAVTPATYTAATITVDSKGRITAASNSGAATITGTETLTNKTLTNPTVNNYTEGVVGIGNSGTSQTIDLTSGTFQTVTLTGNCTFTMPTSTAGKSFFLKVMTGAGGFTATFTGVKWPAATAPTITAAASKYDLISFIADGTAWSGSAIQNYSV